MRDSSTKKAKQKNANVLERPFLVEDQNMLDGKKLESLMAESKKEKKDFSKGWGDKGEQASKARARADGKPAKNEETVHVTKAQADEKTVTDVVGWDKTAVAQEDLYSNTFVQSIPASLVVIFGPDSMVGQQWSIGKNELSLGRSSKCDISIPESSVSKKHLKIHLFSGGKVSISDFGSTNKTLVNDSLLGPKEEIVLRDNDQLKVGNVILKFLDSGNLEFFSIADSFKKSYYDVLTKIGNRAMIETKAPEFFTLSKKFDRPLSLIIFDIDYFKKVNDTYGHLAGDMILRKVAKLSKSCVRLRDLLVRFGGEEFCILLSSSIDRAKGAIENIRKKIEKHVFKHENQEIRITISAGVATQLEKDTQWQDIYVRADKLLYKAKKEGRNKVCSSV